MSYCNEVPPICKRELGLATSQFYSSHNDMAKTYGRLQVTQGKYTPIRNTFWDAEMPVRLSIDSVREHRQLVNFLLPSGTEFSPIRASTVLSVYDLFHGTVDGRVVEERAEADDNLTDLTSAPK